MNTSISIPTEVINRYAFKTKLSIKDANLIFDKLDNFLQNASLKISVPDKQIDGAWHEFILHTKLYFEYCHKKFGRFIHHIPTSSTDCGSNCESDEGPNKSKIKVCETQDDQTDCAASKIQCNSDCQSCSGG